MLQGVGNSDKQPVVAFPLDVACQRVGSALTDIVEREILEGGAEG